MLVYANDAEQYWTHITPEASKYLELYRQKWNSEIGEWPKDSQPLLKAVKYPTIHRLNSTGVKKRIEKIVKSIGMRQSLPEGQKRYEVPLDHGFRKYFNTMLRRAKVNYLDKEDMMGHKVGLESHYERYQEEDYERFPEYQKAIPFLTISDEERLRVEAAEKQEDIERLEQKNEEIKHLQSRLDNVESGLEARRSQYEKGRLAADDSLTSRFLSFAIPLWFESRASESEKKKTWKEFKKRDHSQEEITEILGESKGLSMGNIIESARQFEKDQSEDSE